ncbi:MAG: DUF1232 domain-containing protein [Halobacteriovoraceae bacterium]|mgnify:CR=1 FL=1|jgi:uncharacterized membrane protein YkvA (DUF1232 family)|nr:DUF1232 domain-containing protein [Halobacteriovoraceae bacterium]
MRKKVFAILGILIGVIYILNPTAGVLELIPDNMPFIGNLDEVAAVILILRCLRVFGIDLTGKKKNSEPGKIEDC